MNTRVTRNGQVTIPKRIRDLLGIKPGTAVAFKLTADDKLVMAIADNGKRKLGRFAQVRGTATSGMSTDEIMALTRGGVT